MKKLLSVFGILGLMAFVATPVFAQEDEVVAEDVVVEAENVVDEAADVVDEAVDETVDAFGDLEGIDDFNSLFENEEVQNALAEAGVTNEEAAGLVGGVAGLLAGLGIAGLIIGLIWLVLVIIAMWKIFERAGEAGWKALIPIYNAYIMYKIAGMKNWFWYSLIAVFVGCLITSILGEESSIGGYVSIAASLFSRIVGIVAAYKLPRKFGWGVFASILYVIFTAICILILGFGNYKYEGKSDKTIVEA